MKYLAGKPHELPGHRRHLRDYQARHFMPGLLAFTRMTGRAMSGEEAERWGFFNRLCEPEALPAEALTLAQELAGGPSFAHGMTKNMLQQEWNMGVDQAIEAEAQAQAICMAGNDFHRAYHAFVARQKPVFEGD